MREEVSCYLLKMARRVGGEVEGGGRCDDEKKAENECRNPTHFFLDRNACMRERESRERRFLSDEKQQ